MFNASSGLARLAAAAIAVAAVAFGQQAGLVPPGDPHLFLAFLRMHHAIVNQSGAKTGSSSDTTEVGSAPPVNAALVLSCQQDLGINGADFAAIDIAYVNLQAKLNSVAAEASA